MLLANDPLDSLVSNLHQDLVVVGIPSFNKEKTIARMVLGVQKHSRIVVVCDDDSSDLTGKTAELLGTVVVYHEKNLGYGMTVQRKHIIDSRLKKTITWYLQKFPISSKLQKTTNNQNVSRLI